MPPRQKRMSPEQEAEQEAIRMTGNMAFDAWEKVFGHENADEWQSASMEQAQNFLMSGVVLQKKQWEIAAHCRECDLPEGPKSILAGGGRGSGKSQTILTQIFCDDCQRIKGLKVLCLRKVGRANKEQIQDFRKKLLANLPHTYREQAQTIEFDNGSLVILGNFKDEKDIDKYLGLEYDLIYVMECNQLTRSKIISIESCLRTNKPNWRPRLYLDTNPGGISHVQHKKIFVDPWKAENQTTTRYIHSTVDDNKFVDEGYKKFLETLVGWQREAWLHGSWEFMAGSFFQNFHEDVHVYPNAQTDLNFKAVVRWFAGLDYGFSHPSAFVLCCETESGDIFVTDVYSASSTLIEEHSANIRDVLALKSLEPEELEFIAAGKDCFRVDKDGGTVGTEYQLRGINLTPVHIDRINAWAQVAEVFGSIEHQIRPRCFIHRNCTGLIQQIQSAQSDPKKPNDILKMNCDPETKENGDDELEACFVAGTMVLTERGQRPIEEIKIGGLVWTREGLKKVLAVSVLINKPVNKVHFSNGSILVGTENHPIYANGKWTPIEKVKCGSWVLCFRDYGKIKYLVRETVDENYFTGFADVYNMTVEDCPEYFANGILVHNCRNAIVMAYSSLITNAKPVQMGSWKSLNETTPEQIGGGYVDVEAIILESEQADLNRL